MAAEELDGEGGVNLANYSMIQLDTMVINKADEDGWTPLHMALHHGKFEAARSLLSESDLRVLVLTKDYSTPLHYAVQSASKLEGNLEGAPLSVLESLLERGSIINLQQRSGHSALHTAVAIGSFQVAQWLLDHGADVNLQTKFHSLHSPFILFSSLHHSDPFNSLKTGQVTQLCTLLPCVVILTSLVCSFNMEVCFPPHRSFDCVSLN